MGTGKKLVLASLVSTMMVLAFAIGLLPTLDTLGVTASDGSKLDWSKLYRIMAGDNGKAVTAVDITAPANDGTAATVLVLAGSTSALLPVAADVTPADATVRFGVDGTVTAGEWNGDITDTTVGGVQVVDIANLTGAHSLYALAQVGKTQVFYEEFDQIVLNIETIPDIDFLDPFDDLGPGGNFFAEEGNRITVIQDLNVFSSKKALPGNPLGEAPVVIQQGAITLTVTSASLADFQGAINENGDPFISPGIFTQAVMIVQYAPTLADLQLGNPLDLTAIPAPSAFGLGFVQIAIIYSSDGGTTATQVEALPETLPVVIQLGGLTLAKEFNPLVTSGAGVWSHASAAFDMYDAFSTDFTVPADIEWSKRTGSTLDTFNNVMQIYVDYLSIFAPLETQFSITSVTPPSGPASGLTPVTLNGTFPVASAITNAAEAAAAYWVYFGDPGQTTLAEVLSIDATTANVLTPDSGLTSDTPVDVWIFDKNAPSDFTSLADSFTFIGPPSAVGPTPNQGPLAGGTVVTFTGTNLTTTSDVLFGISGLASFTATATMITATTPPGTTAGPVPVDIVTVGGTVQTGTFTYIAAPVIDSFSPLSGLSNVLTPITITGSGLTGVTGVTVAGVPVSGTPVESDGSTLTIVADMTALNTAPAPIIVTTGGGEATSAENFTYIDPIGAPVINSFTPTSGPINEQTTIIISGSNLIDVTNVTVADIVVADILPESLDGLTLTVVADTSDIEKFGTIIVTTAAGSDESTDLFEYFDPYDPTVPIVNSVSPNSGWVFGGMIVEIVGEAFAPQNRAKVNPADVTVAFGAYPATVLKVTDTSIFVLVPEATNVGLPEASRAVDVTVSRNDDSLLSGSLVAGFTFVKFIQREGEDWTTTASKLGADRTITMVLDGDSDTLATVEVAANTDAVKFNTDVFVLARSTRTPADFGLEQTDPPVANTGTNVPASSTYFDVHTYVLDPAFNTEPAGIDTNNLSAGLNILDENTGNYDSRPESDSTLTSPIGSTSITTTNQTDGQVTIFGDRRGTEKLPTSLTYVAPNGTLTFDDGDTEVYWSTILDDEFTAAAGALTTIKDGRLRGLGTFVVRNLTSVDLDAFGITITPASPTEGNLGTEYPIVIVSVEGGLGFLNAPRFGNDSKAIVGGVGRLAPGSGDGTNEFTATIFTPKSGVPTNAPVDIGLFIKSNLGNNADRLFTNAFTFKAPAAPGARRGFPLALILATALALFGLAGGDDGGGGGGPCFIATAAYGTPMADDIDALRVVRDTYMLDNAIGAAFVDTYYTVSPAIADVVAGNPVIAALVRIALVPVIWMSKLVIAQPTLAMALALLMGALALRRKARRNKA